MNASGSVHFTDIPVLDVASEEIIDNLPNGLALIDSDFNILWGNRTLRNWSKLEDLQGINIYVALGSPTVLGTSVCPFQMTLDKNTSNIRTLQTADNRYFQVHVAPSTHRPGALQLVATITDVTAEILQQQKLAAIHQAGSKLTDLKPEEIFAMDVEQRIELLKDNIRHYTRDLLNVEVIEIRLLEQSTGNLIPLLSVGIDQQAADRRLMASPQGNGVTGFVASSGKSYLCEDASNDPLFLEGMKGAKSSLTVALMLHDQVIGTINVESPKECAFNASDMQFLEIFARDVAVALNTLELLVAQKTNAAQQSCDEIHSAVAIPIDDILLDSVHLMEMYIGHDASVVSRLQRILRNARDIKRSIHQIGQKIAPIETVVPGPHHRLHSKLCGRRVLVVDADEQVRNDAHALLERYGCIVETAHEGDEAVLMVRNCDPNEAYSVIISDIRLPDYSGYQLMLRLQKLMSHVPMVLMTGFGYDPGHSIVKARQAGLHPKAILYKPFRLDQLLNVTETIIDYQPPLASPCPS